MKQLELLAPGGDIDSIKAAVLAGANAVYCGLDRFNARNRAENITIDMLPGILRFVHSQGAQLFLTLNILITESEFPALVTLLNKLVNTSIDAVIVQDIGLFYLLKTKFPTLNVHASTQTTTHNRGQLGFLQKLGATRVNLSRELNFEEIRQLTAESHARSMETEVFVHGSNCISFSGQCFISSVQSGNSGNRGRCSQPCRDRYETTATGSNYPLNLKDNCAFSDVEKLVEMGVDSYKIEGRIKKFHYVFTVVNEWSNQFDRIRKNLPVLTSSEPLATVFNRDFSTAFLTGKLGKEFYSANPMDNSAAKLHSEQGLSSLQTAKDAIYAVRTNVIEDVQAKIDSVSLEKGSLTLEVRGELGKPLTISAITPDLQFAVHSDSVLFASDNPDKQITEKLLRQQWKSLNGGEYQLTLIDCAGLEHNLSLPFKDLAALRKNIEIQLNRGRSSIPPVEFPKPHRTFGESIESSIMICISSVDEIDLLKNEDAQICFELPNSIGDQFDELVAIFAAHEKLIPWFPSILIGEDFESALKLLTTLSPVRIVTNNSGIAFESYRNNIPWIAGPQFNVTNSQTLTCLKTEFGCEGAFISNELSKSQLLPIHKPDGFQLFYSVFHPMVLMTSRQCLFLQVENCGKTEMDLHCIAHCSRLSSITSEKGKRLILEKQPGKINAIYHEQIYCNPQIVSDVRDQFGSFCIDLRNLNSFKREKTEVQNIIDSWKRVIHRDFGSVDELMKTVGAVHNSQYSKGI